MDKKLSFHMNQARKYQKNIKKKTKQNNVQLKKNIYAS